MAFDDNAEGRCNEIRASLIEAHRRRVTQAERALERLLARDDYGFCEACGQFIGLERLHVMPFTPRCAACAARAGSRERVTGPAGSPNGFHGAGGSSDASTS